MESSWDVKIETDISPAEVKILLAQTDWANTRDRQGIENMLNHTSWCVAVRDRAKLVGFARVLTDHTYRAFIEDVIVDEAFRGKGIGSALIEFLLLKLNNVQEITLGCTEQNVSYYQRFGFKKVSHAYMRKTLIG